MGINQSFVGEVTHHKCGNQQLRAATQLDWVGPAPSLSAGSWVVLKPYSSNSLKNDSDGGLEAPLHRECCGVMQVTMIAIATFLFHQVRKAALHSVNVVCVSPTCSEILQDT